MERKRELSAGRWSVIAATATAVLLTAAVLFNWSVDPYQAFGAHDRYVKGTGPQRGLYAGLIRQRPDVEAMVISTSLGANFDPDVAERLFGYRTQIVSLWGGAPRELLELTKYSLRHKPKLKALIIEFNPKAACNFAWSPSARFPTEMYDDGLLGRAAYLASATTLITSAQAVLHDRLGWYVQEFPRSYAEFHRTYEWMRPRFGDVATLKELAAQMPDDRSPDTDAVVEVGGENMADCFRSQYQEIVERHPSVQFHFVTYPAHQWALAKLELRPAQKMYQSLAASLGGLPNLHFHDLLSADRIAMDCARFVDLWHFDQVASDYVLEAVRSRAFERTAASNARLNNATRHLMRTMATCAP